VHNLPDTGKDPAESITILLPRAISGNDAAIGEDATTTSANTTTSLYSPPGTDLRMDWGDACSLGCLPNLNWGFLLVMDKGLEFGVLFPTKIRAPSLAL